MEKYLEELQKEMGNYVLPIRELPNKEWKKNISNKYKNVKRVAFKMIIFLSMEKYGHLQNMKNLLRIKAKIV